MSEPEKKKKRKYSKKDAAYDGLSFLGLGALFFGGLYILKQIQQQKV